MVLLNSYFEHIWKYLFQANILLRVVKPEIKGLNMSECHTVDHVLLFLGDTSGFELKKPNKLFELLSDKPKFRNTLIHIYHLKLRSSQYNFVN